MNRTEAYVSLRDRGCDLKPSKTHEFCTDVTLPNGQKFEVWNSHLVHFAQTVVIEPQS
jgi:hypothetical protein